MLILLKWAGACFYFYTFILSKARCMNILRSFCISTYLASILFCKLLFVTRTCSISSVTSLIYYTCIYMNFWCSLFCPSTLAEINVYWRQLGMCIKASLYERVSMQSSFGHTNSVLSSRALWYLDRPLSNFCLLRQMGQSTMIRGPFNFLQHSLHRAASHSWHSFESVKCNKFMHITQVTSASLWPFRVDAMSWRPSFRGTCLATLSLFSI